MCRSDALSDVYQARRDRWTVANLQYGLANSLKRRASPPFPFQHSVELENLSVNCVVAAMCRSYASNDVH